MGIPIEIYEALTSLEDVSETMSLWGAEDGYETYPDYAYALINRREQMDKAVQVMVAFVEDIQNE